MTSSASRVISRTADATWIGSVPPRWSIEPIGRWFRERKTTVSDAEFPPLSVTMQGIVPQLGHVAKTDNNANRKLVLRGDFAINSRSDRKGSAGVSELDGSVSVITTVLAPMGLDSRFTHYLLRSQPFQEEFYRWGHGIVDDLWSTKWSDMKSIKIPVPPAAEQRAIADYLDRETAQIDAFIAKNEQLVALLEERRHALITRILTEGLNAAHPTKQWRVTQLATLVNGFPFDATEFDSKGEVPLVRIRDLTADVFETFVPARSVPVSALVRDGDVLIGMDGDFNAVLWRRGAAALNQRVCLLRAKRGIADPRFLNYAVAAPLRRINEFTWSTTVKHLSSGAVRSIRVPGFTFAEQRAVADYLDRKTADIGDAIAAARKAIALASERRAALISAVVTGKFDVGVVGA